MKYLIPFILLLAFSVNAQEYDTEWSCKSFTGKSWKHLPAEAFNGKLIYGTSFYQPNRPKSDIFPDGMVGVTFIKCNLTNVLVPSGNTVEGGTNQQIQAQNDWEDWILDSITLEPIEPINKKQRIAAGQSIDPEDIPSQKWTEEEREAFDNCLSVAD